MSFPRIATVTAAVAFACAVLPSLASAADYCVYPAQSCGPNNEMELQPALDEAAATSEADRILLGARTYFVPTGQQGFRYDATKSQVEIVGAGRGQTGLTGDPSSAGQVLTLNGAPGSSVHDLAIQIPSSVTQDFVGLRTKNAARHIEVAEDQPQTQNVIGVFLAENAELEDATIELSTEEASTGLQVFNPAVGMMAVVRGVRSTDVPGSTPTGF